MLPSPFQSINQSPTSPKATPVFHNPNDPNSNYSKMKAAHEHLKGQIGAIEGTRDEEGNLPLHSMHSLKFLHGERLKLEDAMSDTEHAHDVHKSLNDEEKAGASVEPLVQRSREAQLKAIGGR